MQQFAQVADAAGAAFEANDAFDGRRVAEAPEPAK